MIEIDRHIRLKSQGLTWAEATPEQGGGLYVYFKRFDPETGKEVESERSFLKFEDLEAKLGEMERHSAAIREFLKLKPAPAGA